MKIIKPFLEIFGNQFFQNAALVCTDWEMDQKSIIKRKKFMRTEDVITNMFNQKINYIPDP